jgi:DNA-binding NarL/FixJ family response regulator
MPPTSPSEQKASMINLDQMKITRRDQQVLKLLVLGCSNTDIAAELNISHASPRAVKQHLRTLFLRAGIKQGRKRVILATAIFEKEQMSYVATRTVNLPGKQSNHVGLAGAD